MRLINRFIFAAAVLPAFLSLPVAADEVILDDLIINGSLCVGLDCVVDEVFDFDTMKLKSPDPQIRFVDTSSSGAFPTQDWIMGVTDSPTDTSVFFIKDADADTTVLQLSASAGGGVALGAGAELEDGAVSVGTAGAERRITHLANGIDPTDAVNVGQFQTQLTDLQAAIDAINARVDGLQNRLDNL